MTPTITPAQGTPLVSSYKYLSFHLDQELSFKSHISTTVSNLKVNLGFYYFNKFCNRSWYLLFLPLPDYSNVLFMNASNICLHSLNTV